MPERHPFRGDGEQPALLGLGQDGDSLAQQRVDEGPFDRRGNDGELLQGVHGGRLQAPQPREYGVHDRRRDSPGAARGQDLGHEEGVAGGHLVHLPRVEPAGRAELAYGAEGEPGQGQSVHPGPAGHLPQEVTQGVAAAQLVVAVGENEECGQPVDAPDEKAQSVQGRLVRPVHVLDDEYRRMRSDGQLSVEGLVDAVPVTAVRDGSGQLGTHTADEVAERPQRAPSGEIIALADQDPSTPGKPVGQRPDQARLADSGLTEDERHRTGPVRRLPRGRDQQRQLALTFEDPPIHPPIVPLGWAEGGGATAVPRQLAWRAGRPPLELETAGSSRKAI